MVFWRCIRGNAALGAVLFSVAAHATLVVPMDLPQMERQAAVVVHGRVGEIRVEPESGRRWALIEVSDLWRGDPQLAGASVAIPLWDRAIEGGRKIVRVSMAPDFRIGQEVVVFLQPLGPDALGPEAMPVGIERAFAPLGFHQGKFRVLPDAHGIARLLSWRDLPEVPHTDLELKRASHLSSASSSTASPALLPSPADSAALDWDHLPRLGDVRKQVRKESAR